MIADLENIAEILFNNGYNSWGNTIRKAIAKLKEQQLDIKSGGLIMEIIDNTDKIAMYKDIEQGQLFKYYGKLCIKTDIPAEQVGKFKAIRIDTGESYEFNETVLIRPVEATLTIE